MPDHAVVRGSLSVGSLHHHVGDWRSWAAATGTAVLQLGEFAVKFLEQRAVYPL